MWEDKKEAGRMSKLSTMMMLPTLISSLFGMNLINGMEDISCNTCNGENSKCEQECMMEAATKEIEYYDDEELDRFAGSQEDSPQDRQRLEGDRNASWRDREQPEDGWQREYSARRSPILGNSASEIFFYLSERFPYLSEGFSYDSEILL